MVYKRARKLFGGCVIVSQKVVLGGSFSGQLLCL